MRRKMAERIPQIHLCPMCEFVSEDWNKIVEHLIEKHTNEEYWEKYI